MIAARDNYQYKHCAAFASVVIWVHVASEKWMGGGVCVW